MEPRPRTPSQRARAALVVVRQDAAFAWRLPPLVAVLGLVFPWIGAGLVALAAFTGHDTAPAWLLMAGWIGATAGAAAAARQLWLAGRSSDAAVLGALTLLCCLAAGRSSAWGVAVLGSSTPSGLLVLQRQDSLQTAANLLPAAFALVACYGAACPWIARRRRGIPPGLPIPPLFLTSSFLLLALYEPARIIVHGTAVEDFGRWPELCLALALATFARLIQQRTRRATTPVLPALGTA
jgi:hypothetical protein